MLKRASCPLQLPVLLQASMTTSAQVRWSGAGWSDRPCRPTFGAGDGAVVADLVPGIVGIDPMNTETGVPGAPAGPGARISPCAAGERRPEVAANRPSDR